MHHPCSDGICEGGCIFAPMMHCRSIYPAQTTSLILVAGSDTWPGIWPKSGRRCDTTEPTSIKGRSIWRWDAQCGQVPMLRRASILGGGAAHWIWLVGRPSFSFGDVRELASLPDRFGNIVLLDVMYLMPWKLQTSILDWALARLSPGPKSALVIKTMDEAIGFSGFRTLAQEWIMVYLLRRTRSSGTINGIRHFAAYLILRTIGGYRCQIEHLHSFNPSYILRMHR